MRTTDPPVVSTLPPCWVPQALSIGWLDCLGFPFDTETMSHLVRSPRETEYDRLRAQQSVGSDTHPGPVSTTPDCAGRSMLARNRISRTVRLRQRTAGSTRATMHCPSSFIPDDGWRKCAISIVVRIQSYTDLFQLVRTVHPMRTGPLFASNSAAHAGACQNESQIRLVQFRPATSVA